MAAVAAPRSNMPYPDEDEEGLSMVSHEPRFRGTCTWHLAGRQGVKVPQSETVAGKKAGLMVGAGCWWRRAHAVMSRLLRRFCS